MTSTYFEGNGERNVQAKRGYSRDSRPDCVQVCIGLVVSREELPLAFEVFDGNRIDVTTLEEMVELMERKYGQAERVWVIDRGMVSEENLEFLRKRGARYLVGTPRSMLKRFEGELAEARWEEVEPGVEIKLCQTPGGGDEIFILCRSQRRQEKETGILDRFVSRLEGGLSKLAQQAEQGKIRQRQIVERRIGRLLERNGRAASLFEISVEEKREGRRHG